MIATPLSLKLLNKTKSLANSAVPKTAEGSSRINNLTSDDKALAIIQSCFPDRKVVGIDSVDIIWGLGSFHCLSQQEPKL